MSAPVLSPKTMLLAGLQALAIAAAGAWVYWPAIGGNWVWDDAAEVAQNPVMRDPAGLWHVWVAPIGADYFPLKTAAQWVEWALWGDDRMGYHSVSVALHVLSALLFWRLLRRLGLRLAWVGGLLFAIHPLAVESVAWIAEFKNTLSTALVLMAMLAYLRWDGSRPSAVAPPRFQGGDVQQRAGDSALHPPMGPYLFSLGLFLLAMLCKSTVVMLPVVILLHAWWRRGRITRGDVRASAPFFAVSLVLGLVTVWFQHSRAIAGADLGIGGLGSRLAGAGLAAVFYLEKFFVPVGLMPIYPRWSVVPVALVQFWPWLAMGALVGWLVAKRAWWGRGALFGLGCFGVNLLPVLGLVPMSYLRLSWVADHFVYLPMLGLIGLVAGAGGELLGWLEGKAPGLRGAAACAAAAFCAALMVAGRSHAAIYRDNETFWTYALRQNPRAAVAHNDLALALISSGRTAEAIGHLEAALQLQPDYAEAHHNLGDAFAQTGRLPEAIGQFAQALRLQPNFVAARENLASAFVEEGRFDQAIDQFNQVLQLKPDDFEAHVGLGYALVATDRLAEAIEHYGRAIAINPDDPQARNGMGIALAKSRRLDEAIAEFQEAVRLQPSFAEARMDLGQALRLAGRPDEAEIQFREAARLQEAR